MIPRVLSDEATTLLPFEIYVPRIAAGIEEFLKQHESPFLVVETLEEIPGMVSPGDLLLATRKGGRAQARRMVSPIAKRPGANPFADLISVGRGANNDIVIVGLAMSKVHAYFVRTGDAGWSIQDAGSMNGTAVRRERLAPKGPPTPVCDGDVVQFGDNVLANFMTPESFARLLDFFAKHSKKPGVQKN
ncbi:FHA domain-containing protein [bacterium]|nr:FHA domain-containing protein [bacterium]